MYPTISDLIFDLTGIHIPLPIQSFGFMMAISFLLAAYTLSLELKRKEQQGLIGPIPVRTLYGEGVTNWGLFSSFALGFVLGYKLFYAFANYTDFVNDTQGILLSLRGSLFGGLIGGALAAFLHYRDREKHKLPKPEWKNEMVHPHEMVGNITIVAALTGLIGAKIFHNLENLDEFAADPWGSLVSFSGLTMYGGLIVGGAGVIWYARKNNIHPFYIMDAAAPGLMLAYGFGRLGCHISGDGDWGIVNNTDAPAILSFLPDWFWKYDYPHNVLNIGVPIQGCTGNHCMVLPDPVFPTPLYEAIVCITLFFILWGLRKKIAVPGMVFSIFLIMNGVERFLIEKIRVNTTYNIWGYAITQAEIISVVLIVAGVAGLFLFKKLHRHKTILRNEA